MHSFKEYFYYLWKKMSERQQRSYFKSHYKYEIEKFNSATNKKSKGQIRKEMKLLQKYWGEYPFQYIRYKMYEQECTLNIEQMKQYIPNYFAYYLFFPRIYKEYGYITEDKSLTDSFFTALNIPQPLMLFKYSDQNFFDTQNNLLNNDQINKCLQKSEAERIFIKPTFGLGGVGIQMFSKSNNEYTDNSGNHLNAKYIETIANKNDYIFQVGLMQHPEINKIYAKSINTFRIFTKTEAGTSKLMYAMLRLGQKGAVVDNASQTGITCKVDINTGKFDEFAYSGLRTTMKTHPDTGFVFKDYIFPYWDQIKNFMLTTALKFHKIKYLGWDLAYTKTGPVIIEANAGAGLEFLQDCYGGVRDGFEIKNPKKYWYNKNFVIKDLYTC